MAEPVPVEGKSLEELESEIICVICQEHYTEPKVLPCLHYYCKKCILDLAQRTQSGKSFHCPECRSEATLPEGGVDNLKTAFFANRLKSKVMSLQRAHGKVEVKCELCTKSPPTAKAFCRQCARFICNECVQLHSNLQVFLTHEIASLEDLKQGRAKPIAVKEPTTSKCEVHEEPFIIYCYDCSCLICQHCTLKDHLGHNYEFTKKAAPGAKAKLLEHIKCLKALQDDLIKAGEKIGASKIEIEAQKQASINSLHTSFKELHNILEQHEQELVEDATTIAQHKLQNLSQQEKTLLMAGAELQNVVDYTERCASLSTDNELVSMDTEIMKTIQQKIQEHSKSGRSLEPAEEADMAVEITCAEALQQLCLTQANITTAVDPAKCTVHLTAPAEVGKPYVGTFTTRLSNGKPNNRNCKVTCHIKSVHNGATTDWGIDIDEPGHYSIEYTPTVRGCHELIVLINGHHVLGSPFCLYSIPPSQLGKPVKIWTGISRPYGITANSKGEILVTLSEGTTNIVKYDSNGKRFNLVKKSMLVYPRCIACDDENEIYCVDEESNMILTCDGNGNRLKIHAVELEKNSPGRSALAIVDQKLFMAEIEVPGIIKVYNKQLQHVSTIKHRDMLVKDICGDSHQYLYVSDIDNSCVHVFTMDGVHLRSIGQDKEELNMPWGVCVRGQYLYVSNVISHCVFVFTTDGEYVTSFGQQSGQFNVLYYIYVDINGYIYIPEICSNKIHIF